MFWNVKTWQLHSGHWRYWEKREKGQESTFWGYLKMDSILITVNRLFDPFCSNEWQGWARCPPECRGAGTCGNVLHICQLSAVWWWPAPADRMQYFIPSALSPVNPHTINGPSYSSRHAEARYFIVSCSGRKCDEDRDTKQRVTRCEHRSLVSLSPRYYLTPPLHVSV